MALKALASPVFQAPMLRLYSARAAPQAAVRREPLPREPPRTTSLPNGLIVTSVENNHPIARLSIAVKAGSRYEDYFNLGVSHTLRNCCGLSTKNFTGFGQIRNLQLFGAEVTATATREYIIYTLQCNRDYVKEAMKYVNAMICEQVFKPWEVRDNLPRQKIDVSGYQQRPNAVVIEKLHKVAFRSGLGNSIYSPQYMVGRHDTTMLTNFVKSTFATNRMAVAGVGMNHDFAVECANLIRYEGGATAQEVPAKYGGGEIRVERVMPYAHVAIAAYSAGAKNAKEAMAAAVLQHMLGVYPQVKRGMTQTKLLAAASKVTENPFAVTCLNLNYSDAGLFGFYVTGQAEDMSKLVKSLVDVVSGIKSGVNEQEVQVGKQRLKALVHMGVEHGTDLVEEMVSQAFQYGKSMDVAEIDSLIDSITASDVNNIAKKITSGKPSMAAVGNLINTPYLDQIR